MFFGWGVELVAATATATAVVGCWVDRGCWLLDPVEPLDESIHGFVAPQDDALRVDLHASWSPWPQLVDRLVVDPRSRYPAWAAPPHEGPVSASVWRLSYPTPIVEVRGEAASTQIIILEAIDSRRQDRWFVVATAIATGEHRNPTIYPAGILQVGPRMSKGPHHWLEGSQSSCPFYPKLKWILGTIIVSPHGGILAIALRIHSSSEPTIAVVGLAQ